MAVNADARYTVHGCSEDRSKRAFYELEQRGDAVFTQRWNQELYQLTGVRAAEAGSSRLTTRQHGCAAVSRYDTL